MISFREFLAESRSAPLYHGTNISALRNILKIGIEPRTLHETGRIGGIKNHTIPPYHEEDIPRHFAKGVSLSRNLKFSGNHASGLVLELNYNKLSHRFRIVPFQFFQDRARCNERIGSNEYEEFVVTTKPIPFKYVERIWIPNEPAWTDGEAESPTIKAIRQQYGSSFIRVYNR